MTGWNYPPGVSGNEPFLTGEPDFDPHAPFWAAPDPEHKTNWCVYQGNSEDEYWMGLTEDDAIELAETLNWHYSLSGESRAKDGHCRVCGDYHGDPEELYEKPMRKVSRGGAYLDSDVADEIEKLKKEDHNEI